MGVDCPQFVRVSRHCAGVINMRKFLLVGLTEEINVLEIVGVRLAFFAGRDFGRMFTSNQRRLGKIQIVFDWLDLAGARQTIANGDCGVVRRQVWRRNLAFLFGVGGPRLIASSLLGPL